MPSNLSTGAYVVDTYLIENEKVIDKRVTNLKVAHVGVNAGMHKFAYSYSFAYAILVVFIAVFAGWFSNAVRRKK